MEVLEIMLDTNKVAEDKAVLKYQLTGEIKQSENGQWLIFPSANAAGVPVVVRIAARDVIAMNQLSIPDEMINKDTPIEEVSST